MCVCADRGGARREQSAHAPLTLRGCFREHRTFKIFNILTRQLMYDRRWVIRKIRSPQTQREPRSNNGWCLVASTLGIAVRFHQMPRTHRPPKVYAVTKRSRTIVRQHPMQHEEPSCSSAFSRSAVPLPLHLQNWSSNVVQMKWRSPPYPRATAGPVSWSVMSY